MLQEYRVQNFPVIYINELAGSERKQLSRMNNYFYGLHFLVGLADAAEKTVKLWESQTKEKSASLETQRLVRTTRKAFTTEVHNEVVSLHYFQPI